MRSWDIAGIALGGSGQSFGPGLKEGPANAHPTSALVQVRDETMTEQHTSYEIIETISALSQDALALDQACCSCTPGEHHIPAGIKGIINILAWAISVEDSYKMVDGALPLLGYLMGTEGTDEIIDRMGKSHPEVTQLIELLRTFCPKGREKG